MDRSFGSFNDGVVLRLKGFLRAAVNRNSYTVPLRSLPVIANCFANWQIVKDGYDIWPYFLHAYSEVRFLLLL